MKDIEAVLKSNNIPYTYDSESGIITIDTKVNRPVMGKRFRAYYCPSQNMWQAEHKSTGAYIRQCKTREEAEALIRLLEDKQPINPYNHE
jgi:hypothetical protein